MKLEDTRDAQLHFARLANGHRKTQSFTQCTANNVSISRMPTYVNHQGAIFINDICHGRNLQLMPNRSWLSSSGI